MRTGRGRVSYIMRLNTEKRIRLTWVPRRGTEDNWPQRIADHGRSLRSTAETGKGCSQG